MEFIKFVTPEGEVQFRDRYMVTKIEGLNEGSVKCQEYDYIDTDGAEYDNSLYTPRTVTVTGYIKSNHLNALSSDRARLTRILNGKYKGLLYYKVGNRQYFTEAIPELPEFGERVQNFMPFVVCFNLYRFYWKEERTRRCDIWKREDMIKGPFTFPMVFTMRENTSVLFNGGDVATPVVINVYGGLGKSVSTLDISTGLTITNKSTGEYMELEYDIAENEIITINTEKATVISNINGNILHKLTEQSVFFKLRCGENTVEVINYSTAQIYATAEFYNLLVGV